MDNGYKNSTEEHGRKKIAPVIITIVVVVYYLVYFVILMYSLPPVLREMFGIFPLVLAGVMVYVCMERLKEIDGGEEDDISKY